VQFQGVQNFVCSCKIFKIPYVVSDLSMASDIGLLVWSMQWGLCLEHNKILIMLWQTWCTYQILPLSMFWKSNNTILKSYSKNS
jgi:hypothetical protein